VKILLAVTYRYRLHGFIDVICTLHRYRLCFPNFCLYEASNAALSNAALSNAAVSNAALSSAVLSSAALSSAASQVQLFLVQEVLYRFLFDSFFATTHMFVLFVTLALCFEN